jgi:ABC-type phosphate transport system substrate-binding protein
MPRSSRSSIVPGIILVIILAFTVACNSGSKSLSNAPQAGGTNSNQIIGAGSTFIYPIMSRWIADFQNTHSGVQINYQSIGSGGGIQQLKNGLVDFGASDAALDDQQLKEMPPVVQVPESAGPVCITYNPQSQYAFETKREQPDGNLPWHDQKLAGAGDSEGQSRSDFT